MYNSEHNQQGKMEKSRTAKEIFMDKDVFPIRAYGRTELAVCYFPHLNSQTAYRKLQQWIDLYPRLRERLEAAAPQSRSRMYMPVQVQMIVEAIGEPWLAQMPFELAKMAL